MSRQLDIELRRRGLESIPHKSSAPRLAGAETDRRKVCLYGLATVVSALLDDADIGQRARRGLERDRPVAHRLSSLSK